MQEQQDSTLEGFMKVCEDNAHATRAKLPNAWAKLAGIHDAYKNDVRNSVQPPGPA